MNNTIVEIEAPTFKELTEQQYNKILDNYGEYQRKTIDEIKHYENTLKDLNSRNHELENSIYILKETIKIIIERI